MCTHTYSDASALTMCTHTFPRHVWRGARQFLRQAARARGGFCVSPRTGWQAGKTATISSGRRVFRPSALLQARETGAPLRENAGRTIQGGGMKIGEMIESWIGGALVIAVVVLLAWGYCAATPAQTNAENDLAEVVR